MLPFNKSTIALAAFVLAMLIVTINTVYTVSEGYVGIVKRFGKAINQVDPGIHVKIPFVDTVTDIEVRQRKTIEDLQAATQDQLPITAAVSINWTVVRPSTIDMFRQYGNLEQFENRILNPKLRSATKAALSRFPANKLIQERQTVVAEIMNTMTGELAEFPITINSPQLENIELPRRYVEAVEAKETAREGGGRTGKARPGTAASPGPAGRQLGGGGCHGEETRRRRRSVPRQSRSDSGSRCHRDDYRPTGEKSRLHPPGDGEKLERLAAGHHAGFKHPAPVATGRPRQPVDSGLR